VVLCVDEKSQIQALERTQRMPPMGLGYVEGVTHDYRRHETTTLSAALDAAKGTVIAQCQVDEHRGKCKARNIWTFAKSATASFLVTRTRDEGSSDNQPR
jgi:hypothetical protein